MATPGRPTLAPEIERFRNQFEQLSAEADALTGPLSDEQFIWRPAATTGRSLNASTT